LPKRAPPSPQPRRPHGFDCPGLRLPPNCNSLNQRRTWHRRATAPACSALSQPPPGVPPKEGLMARTPRLTDLRNPPPAPITTGNGEWQRADGPHQGRPAANPCRRRFDRVVLGFWLGGVILGVGGCLFGASRPYQHPVGVAVSVLWWGIYCGCFGASIGALVGIWAEPTPASPSPGPDGAGKPPSGTDSPALPAGSGGPLSGASRGAPWRQPQFPLSPEGGARPVESAGERRADRPPRAPPLLGQRPHRVPCSGSTHLPRPKLPGRESAPGAVGNPAAPGANRDRQELPLAADSATACNRRLR
jgi:hypothetical protein